MTETLANRLRYDRVGYGIVFNNLTVSVDAGAVTVGGNVRDHPDRDSAIGIVQTTPSVRDVIDEIDVAPVSTFDDQLRVRLARAIYGEASLQKYAIDPQAPIRIVVKNGHVELAGVVLDKGDRQVAFMRANSVPGVFSVKNSLVVASEQSDKKRSGSLSYIGEGPAFFDRQSVLAKEVAAARLLAGWREHLIKGQEFNFGHLGFARGCVETCLSVRHRLETIVDTDS